MPKNTVPPQPDWYKDAVIYELHIKAFSDADGDGKGDFRGLTAKLDYLRDLGVTAVWLLPFYPSPLRDDGYDIADYMDINPDYGTLADFKRFLKAAHDRDIRVITELVLNHTSDRHEWFRKARAAKPGSSARRFYVWSDSQDKYAEARIIFQDFERSNWTWDAEAQAYYWHRFYHHQPDLNFDHAPVKKALFKVMDFWFGLGVDGMRLDAIPYLYEREGTNCENLPETHAFLKELRAYVDARHPGRMFLAEANQWPEDAVAYFGRGDECHMCFHFPIMPRIFMALWMEDRFPILDILDQTPAIPDACQWAMFLRNHDELTLEMVSDEERDYMYRAYARDERARINLGIRRRLAPLMGNDRRRIELINFLLFSLPGTPIVYYGDELGMGDNCHLGDRDGVRTPMQWSADRNAGFSQANPQKLYLPLVIDPEYHYEVINVENQESNPSSLLWWMRRVIAMRKRHPAFGRGDVTFLTCDNPGVLAFVRRDGRDAILVVANLSRFSQVATLDLSEYAGATPEDLFGGTAFPVVGREPYVLPLSFHAYHWLRLVPAEAEGEAERGDAPEVVMPRSALGPVSPAFLEKLEESVLPDWFRSAPGRAARRSGDDGGGIEVADAARLANGGMEIWFYLLRSRTPGESEGRLLAAALGFDEHARELEEPKSALLARVVSGPRRGVLADGLAHARVRRAVAEFIADRRRLKGARGEFSGACSKLARLRLLEALDSGGPGLLDLATANALMTCGDTLLLKIYRRPEPGHNPEIELLEFLREAGFAHAPRVLGKLEYAGAPDGPHRGERYGLGILFDRVPQARDAWSLATEEAARFFERRRAEPAAPPAVPKAAGREPDPGRAGEGAQLFSGYFAEFLALLGQRTAHMHLALASAPKHPVFAPERFSKLYQRAVYQSVRNLARQVLQGLRRDPNRHGPGVAPYAAALTGAETRVLELARRVTDYKVAALKTRIHGSFHLGQVLLAGNEITFIDFEGDPARPFGERKLKRSPLRDAASMVLSLFFAAHIALRRVASAEADAPSLAAWADQWGAAAADTFVRGWRAELARAAAEGEAPQAVPLVPQDDEQVRALLDTFLLEQAFLMLAAENIEGPGRKEAAARFVLNLTAARTGAEPGAPDADEGSAAPRPQAKTTPRAARVKGGQA